MNLHVKSSKWVWEQDYQTKLSQPSFLNQTFQTKPTKPNQIYWQKQLMPGSLVPLVMLFVTFVRRYILCAPVHRVLPEGGSENDHAGGAATGGFHI